MWRIRRAAACVDALERRLLLSSAQFASPVATTVGTGLGAPFAVVVTDVTGDGIPDAVVANSNGTISILPGKGDGTFGTPITFSDYLPMGSGTGHDLAVTSSGDEIFVTNTAAQGDVSILSNNGKGVFHLAEQPHVTKNDATISALTYTLFPTDLYALVTADSDGEIGITPTLGFNRPSDSTFYYSASTYPLTSLAIGDINGDGEPDILVRSSDGKIHVSSFVVDDGTPYAVYASDTQAAAIATAYLEGGFTCDLVVINEDGAVATLLGGKGGLTPGETFAAGPATADAGLIAGDIQGNGLQDALLLDYNPSGGAQVQTLLSNDNGTLSPDRSPFYSAAPLTLADVNGDGKADLIAAYYDAADATTKVSVSLNDGPDLPRFSSTNEAFFPTSLFDSFTVQTRGFQATPVITMTGNLPADIHIQNNGDGTATISGSPTPADVGNYFVTLEANDGIDPPVTQAFQIIIRIHAPPAIYSADHISFPTGSFSSTPILTDGFPHLPVITETGFLPSDIQFHDQANGTASISGTPAIADVGSYPIIIEANDGIDPPVFQNFTLTIYLHTPPSITSAASTTFTVGRTGSFTITTYGAPVPTITESGTLPAGILFQDNGESTATLSGNPSPGSGGVYDLTITAANGVGTNATQTFVLTINEAPSIVSAMQTSFTIGVARSFTVKTFGYPLPSLTEMGALPQGVAFRDNGNGTATLSGTPAPGTDGTYDIAFKTTNNLGSGSQSFVLTINQAAAFTSPSQATFSVGVAGSFTLTATGDPIPLITTNLSALPSGLTFSAGSNGAAILSGTPAVGTGGQYNLVFTAANGIGNPATQAFTLTITEGVSITSANTATFYVGAFGSFPVTTRGYPRPTITETGALPSIVSLATVTGSGSGWISGAPIQGLAGNYPITLSASNGVGSPVTQSFILHVLGAPFFLGGNAVNLALTTSDSINFIVKANPTVIFSETGKLPAGLSFVDNANNTLTLSGTPPKTDKGSYTIGLTATNNLGSTTKDVVLTIAKAKAPKFTSATTANFTVGTQGSFTITTTGISSPALVQTSGPIPIGLTLTNNGDGTATLSGTPLPGSGGVYPLAFAASNSKGQKTQTLTVTVLEATIFTDSPTTNFVVGQAGSATIQTTGYPVGALSEIGAMPQGLIFHDNGNGSATISGTPAVGTGGKYTLTIMSSNVASKKGSKKTISVGSGATVQTYILNVEEAPLFTSKPSATLTAGANNNPQVVMTTSGFPYPTLSEVGALPAGMTFLDEGNGTAVLQGNPQTGTQGTYMFVITALNNEGMTTQKFTLTVM